MPTDVEFCLLGPLMVCHGGTLIRVPRGKQRVILATLLLNADRVVGVDDLVETLWGSGPPPSSLVAAQNYVMRLRKTLGDAGRDRIVTQLPGYLIRVADGELDVSRFEARVGEARAAARDGSWDRAAIHARTALDLWRGEPLVDVDSDVLAAREVPRLRELRLQAMEVRLDAELNLARHADVIAELRQLARAHPLREHLHGLLMLALYRDGRQAEALAAYHDVRQVLVRELGTEPGVGLQKLQHQMLTADPALNLPERRQHAVGGHEPVVPRELPAAARHFTGRVPELETLTGLLDQAGGGPPGTVVISAVGGTAGVGKTALAVHWAHQVAARFPDGQLYVNLRGYDLGQPVTAADALAGFLRALGVPSQDIPPEEDERARRYRSAVAGKRMLAVLDNAGDEEQVRPLLPGTPSCAVVVTSRDPLAGLVARDGAVRLDLDSLPAADAVSLLRALIGGRVDADPDGAAALAAYCCRLPLALRVAAELVVSRPAVPLAELAAELADQQRRLDLLEAGGDFRTAVRTVFSWSYRNLDAAAARAFRLAGLHPGPDFDSHALAALAGGTVAQTRRSLDVLARAQLVKPTGPDRHGMHDLLRAYARELAVSLETTGEQEAALTRLLDHYLHAAAAAMDALFPAEQHRRPAVTAPSDGASSLPDAAAAREWLDAERVNLAAATAYAAGHGRPGHATRLAAVMFRYLENAGHYSELAATSTHALRAAHDVSDHTAEAHTLSNLAAVDLRQGRYEQAVGHLRRALVLHRETGDHAGEARTLGNLGLVMYQQGRYRQATDCQQQSLKLRQEMGDRGGEANTLNNLGIIDLRQGCYARAADHLGRALVLYREVGDHDGQAYALANLGRVDVRQKRYPQAAARLDRSLAMFRESGNPVGEAHALTSLGVLGLWQGRPELARDFHQQAVTLSREMGDLSGEAEALNGLGEVFLAIHEPGSAWDRHTSALALADQIGDKNERARAHDGLGRAAQASGDAERARRHWRRALSLYTELGAPEADQVRARLEPAEPDRPERRA